MRVKSDCHHCFYTVSGGIRENETSESAVIRECYEETGYHFEIDRLVFLKSVFSVLTMLIIGKLCFSI